MPLRWIVGLSLVLCLTRASAAEPLGGGELAQRFEEIAARAGGGRVGIAATLLETGATIVRDGRGRYPMQSVYKLPIAMAVLDAVDHGRLSLAQVVRVEPAEFVSKAQHSPLRDAHPAGVELPLEEILRLAVAESDGTASDVLLRLLGGAQVALGYVRRLGIADLQVLDTEQAIGRDHGTQYANWASPEAAVALLRAVHEGRALRPASRDLILRWAAETGTGRRRLKALLPPGTAVAHKTGTSGTTAEGVTAATNDIGLITLPDGRTLALAVFVSDSPADEAARERVIAEVARAVWDAAAEPARGGGRWQRDGTSLAWTIDGRVIWRFVYDDSAGKPFFHPLATARHAAALTELRPADHPWHYGLWFSWKFINGANYWEEERATGRAEGRTRWTLPEIEAGHEGAAVIRLGLTYVHPSGREDLFEQREIRVSALSSDGGYTIDWRGSFTAGGDGVRLDRTPMPGEPGGQPWGGYGGLGIRFVGPSAVMTPLTLDGPVPAFVDQRARPVSAALAVDFAQAGAALGGVAIVRDPANERFSPGAPWYLVRSDAMHFLGAAELAPRPVSLTAGARFDLRYRILVRPGPWTVEALRTAAAE